MIAYSLISQQVQHTWLCIKPWGGCRKLPDFENPGVFYTHPRVNLTDYCLLID